ncbi:MAG TPA: PAS domain S-box protein [Longimicrobiales bacterium]
MTERTPAGLVPADAESAELYRRLVDSVTDYAIYALDRRGCIVSWNAGAERLKGYTREEVLGKHLSLFYPPEDPGKAQRLLDDAARYGRVEDEGWRVRKDGSRFWASALISALRNERGEHIGFSKVTRDLTERRAALEALRRSEERFRLLVQHVADYAIFMLDPNGIVASWNEGAQRIKGYTAEEIIGQSFKKFYPEEKVAERFPDYELEVAAREGRFEDEGWRIRKDGSRFWANVVITALRDPDSGELIGFAKVTRDLTARREAEEMRARHAAAEAARQAAEQRSEELTQLNHQLEEQAAELEQQAEEMAQQAEELEQQTVELEMLTEKLEETNVDLQRALRQSEAERQAADLSAASATAMTSFVSHDLRNPLNAIVMASSLLEEGSLDAGRAGQQLGVIRRAAEQMQRLIEDLLDVAKAEGTGMHVERRTESIAAIFTQAYEEFQMRAADAGVELRAELESDLPRVYADRDRILQVLSNLIGNAVKFTERGGSVTLKAVRRRELVEIAVTDTGIGIPAEDLSHVFDRFWQARRSSRASAGLGLAIAKSIVEAHDGAIEVESTPGRGSTFRFTLPIAR